MDHSLIITQQIAIQASAEDVWAHLTNPETLKKCFYGADVVSDWEAGSEIIFTGEYEGKSYRDKGLIKTSKPGVQLTYSYWSGFSGLEDKEENYSLVDIKFRDIDGDTIVMVTQTGFPGKEQKDHGNSGWKSVLNILKVEIAG